MRFLPLFLDTSAGVFILVGSGEPALAKLRLLRSAGAHVRWFSGHRRRCGRGADASRARAARDRASATRCQPTGATSSPSFRAAGDALDQQIAARARRATHPGQCRRPAGALDLHLSRHRRSRRGGGGDRHRRGFAGAGAAPARADRSVAAGAHRRSCRIDRPLSRALRRGAARRCRRAASGRTSSTVRSPQAVLAGRAAEAEAQLAAAIEARAGDTATAARARPCIWSAPVPAIPIC